MLFNTVVLIRAVFYLFFCLFIKEKWSTWKYKKLNYVEKRLVVVVVVVVDTTFMF